jgi:DNA-binding MarR family transcriptional regulator
MCDLARRLQLSPSGLTRRLDGMVKAGWVRRQNSQIDRRVMLAELTDAGRTALDDAAPGHVASVRRHLIDRLDRHQVQVMAEIFTAVGDGLRKESDVP